MRLSKPNSGETKIDNRTIAKNSQGNIVNLDDFKLDRAITFYERFSFNFNKYSGGKAHLYWGVNANTYLKRYSNGVSGKYRLTSKLFTNEELNSYINEFGQGCFLSWHLEVTSKYTTYPVFVVEKEFNCDLPRTLEGETGEYLPLASVRLFMNENNELDEYNTQVFRYFDNSIPAESFVRPYYWEYQNYAEMKSYYTNVPSGQLARVLDNSDAPEPTEGWAVYQQDYNNKVNKGFKLVSLQPNEAEESIKLSNKTFAKSNLDQFVNLDSYRTLPVNVKILEDFDFEIIATSRLIVKPNGKDFIDIPIDVNGVRKNLNIPSFDLPWVHREASSGDLVHWHVTGSISDNPQGKPVNYGNFINHDGSPREFDQSTGTYFPILTIQAKQPFSSGRNFNKYHIKTFKHWKHSLAPAEERIPIPELPEVQNLIPDNISVIKYDSGNNTFLISPENFKPYDERFKFLEDFDFKVNNFDYGSGDYRLRFDAINGSRRVKVLVGDDEKFLSLHFWIMDLQKFRDSYNAKTGDYIYFKLYAGVSNTDILRPHSSSSSMGGITNAKLPLSSASQVLFTGRIKLPNLGETFDLSTLYLWKHWKKALVPAEERIVIPEIPEANGYFLDETTLFETVLSEKTKIFAPALCQTHPVNFRILEDFDFNFSVGKTYTGNKTYLDIDVIGGNRYIPVLVNGTRKYMSIMDENVIMNDVFGSSFAGKWKYFVLMASIHDTESGLIGLGTESESSGNAMFVSPYINNTQFKFVQIGVKFNSDGETLDYKNVKIFKYWKNALATFSELWAEKVTP